MNILAMLKWLMDNTRLPENSTLTNIGYGFKIRSGGGQPKHSPSADIQSRQGAGNGEAGCQ